MFALALYDRVTRSAYRHRRPLKLAAAVSLIAAALALVAITSSSTPLVKPAKYVAHSTVLVIKADGTAVLNYREYLADCPNPPIGVFSMCNIVDHLRVAPAQYGYELTVVTSDLVVSGTSGTIWSGPSGIQPGTVYQFRQRHSGLGNLSVTGPFPLTPGLLCLPNSASERANLCGA